MREEFGCGFAQLPVRANTVATHQRIREDITRSLIFGSRVSQWKK